MMVTWNIYALVDPRDGTDRYVGCTTKSPERRLQAHLSDARVKKDARCDWIRDVRSAGLRPKVRLLETVAASRHEAHVAEYRWMDRLSNEGANLLNVMRPGYRMPLAQAFKQSCSRIERYGRPRKAAGG